MINRLYRKRKTCIECNNELTHTNIFKACFCSQKCERNYEKSLRQIIEEHTERGEVYEY